MPWNRPNQLSVPRSFAILPQVCVLGTMGLNALF